MRKKLIEGGLFVFIAGTIFFVGTYSVYTLTKERDCGKSLYSADCYRTYVPFLEKAFLISK